MRKALEYGYGVSGQNADHIDPASATCNGHALHKAKCIIAHSSEFIRNATGIFELWETGCFKIVLRLTSRIERSAQVG